MCRHTHRPHETGTRAYHLVCVRVCLHYEVLRAKGQNNYRVYIMLLDGTRWTKSSYQFGKVGSFCTVQNTENYKILFQLTT